MEPQTAALAFLRRGHAVGCQHRLCAGGGRVCSPQGGICKLWEKPCWSSRCCHCHLGGMVSDEMICVGILQKQKLAAR